MNLMAGLLTAGSIYSSRLPDLFDNSSVAIREFRPRTQRRVRTGISPASLLGPEGTITRHELFKFLLRQSGPNCQVDLELLFEPDALGRL